MFVELKDPYTVLPKAGYTMQGTSNAFRKHIPFKGPSPYKHRWFHAYVQHDNASITIHIDKSKEEVLEQAYKHHKVFHGRQHYDGHEEVQGDIGEEIRFIKTFEV